MLTIIESIKSIMEESFEKAGYDKKYGFVSVSNRPDLCQYQCNGAMAAAKEYKKAPIAIANDVLEAVGDNEAFKSIEAVNPGFININLSEKFILSFISEMSTEEKFGINLPKQGKKVVIDYGGPNVAKSLHVGHLRSAVIGESVKRILRYMGDDIVGDVHLGDWGLQIGLVITELSKRKPDLPYFDDNFEGEYPKEAPFTIEELCEIYPYASGYSKEHEDYLLEAQENTAKFQNGDPGFKAIWNHILDVSIADLKKNYDKLNVEFDIWNKESDVQPLIPEMIDDMKNKGLLHESEGALVVDVAEESDKKEIPPCIVVKSNGATLYATTDLATIVDRKQQFNPDEIIYVVDKRQSMYFTQVFRTAKKSGLVDEDTNLVFIGFGTMNGKDGKPFKTRDGGVLRLQDLREDVTAEVLAKIKENRDYSDEEGTQIAEKVGVAAIKYGDLSNQASKDYIFDISRFASFEGNTGPYILYTIVRIKSLLAKYQEEGGIVDEKNTTALLPADSDSEIKLQLSLLKFGEIMQSAYEEKAPHKICQFIYELSDSFNHFYHENKILGNDDENRKKSYIQLLILVKRVLEQCIDLLGFDAPERM
ncbi:MAG: arginine--tRNA ligase [Eubacterium sp.]|nr:arginine--tRNA ligase [Eubacterium sp.]